MKRVFDLACCSIGLALLSPVFLLIALAIRIDSPGPVFYRGIRAGRNGNPFCILKFRTMVADAAASGPPITTREDPRITRAGRFLRKWKLDELPQLLNVLRGDMALVGPRPEDLKYVADYSREQRKILYFPPGITSPASIVFRDESNTLAGLYWESIYVKEIMPRKLEMDLEYFSGATFFSDLGVIFKTILF